jgi:hypothetical protein
MLNRIGKPVKQSSVAYDSCGKAMFKKPRSNILRKVSLRLDSDSSVEIRYLKTEQMNKSESKDTFVYDSSKKSANTVNYDSLLKKELADVHEEVSAPMIPPRHRLKPPFSAKPPTEQQLKYMINMKTKAIKLRPNLDQLMDANRNKN